MSASKNLAYISEVFAKILKESKRSELSYIQKALCNAILPRFDDFQKDYKYFRHFKACASLDECLARVFDIKPLKMQNILKKLEAFKNIQDDALSCLNVKI